MHEGDRRPSRTGARVRRRGLYGPPPRLTRTSPLVGRLLWHIGDWGRASEHIGVRWEEVAGPLARDRLGNDSYLVVLASTPSLMAAVLGSGLPHADALRAWPQDGYLALEPLDFKWSLETASARQVSGETLTRLLDADLPALVDALQAARAALGLDASADPEPRDGRFVAPEHPANRAALRAEPNLPSLLLPVDPQAFFRPLPGWPAARAVAQLENGNLERLHSIEAVERYYRLGAGVAGALARLHTGLFEAEPREVDAPALIAELRRAGHAANVNALLLWLERELGHRRMLEERLNQLPRVAYPFGRLRSDLARSGVPAAVLEQKGVLGRAYGEVTRDLLAAMRAAGQQLMDAGISPEAALSQLAAEPGRWSSYGTARARRLAQQLKTGQGTGTST